MFSILIGQEVPTAAAQTVVRLKGKQQIYINVLVLISFSSNNYVVSVATTVWQIQNPSIHPFSFSTTYHTQHHREPGVYPRRLGAQGGGKPRGHNLTKTPIYTLQTI